MFTMQVDSWQESTPSPATIVAASVKVVQILIHTFFVIYLLCFCNSKLLSHKPW